MGNLALIKQNTGNKWRFFFIKRARTNEVAQQQQRRIYEPVTKHRINKMNVIEVNREN